MRNFVTAFGKHILQIVDQHLEDLRVTLDQLLGNRGTAFGQFMANFWDWMNHNRAAPDKLLALKPKETKRKPMKIMPTFGGNLTSITLAVAFRLPLVQSIGNQP